MKNYFENLWDAICGKQQAVQVSDPIIKLGSILERVEEEESLKPDGIDGNFDGYNDAIVGITDDGRLVYSKEIMVDICERDGDMGYEDAVEWLEYNTFCAYVGKKTPLFIHTGY